MEKVTDIPTDDMDYNMPAINRPASLKSVAYGAVQMQKYAEEIAEEVAARVFVMKQIEEKAREDVRANKRNLNRMLTLFGALFIGLILTYLLTNPAILMSLGMSPKLIKFLAPYTFVITILMDSTLALYSFIRKY